MLIFMHFDELLSSLRSSTFRDFDGIFSYFPCGAVAQKISRELIDEKDLIIWELGIMCLYSLYIDPAPLI